MLKRIWEFFKIFYKHEYHSKLLQNLFTNILFVNDVKITVEFIVSTEKKTKESAACFRKVHFCFGTICEIRLSKLCQPVSKLLTHYRRHIKWSKKTNLNRQMHRFQNMYYEFYLQKLFSLVRKIHSGQKSPVLQFPQFSIFLCFFFGVLLTLYYVYMCSETDFTQ